MKKVDSSVANATEPVVPDAGPHAASHATAPKPRGEREIQCRREDQQKGLDAPAEVPLHVRPVLTYAQLDALGVVPERTLRRLVAIGRVKRAVLRVGRSVRFVVADLLDELRQVEA